MEELVNFYYLQDNKISDKLMEICRKKYDVSKLEQKSLNFDQAYKEAKSIALQENSVTSFKFYKAILDNHINKKIGVIAEIKKASPSAGIIVQNFNHLEIADVYKKMHASAISILTESEYFLGKNQYVSEVRKYLNHSIPLLRKDFVIDMYQVVTSKIIGADCILLIMATCMKNKKFAQEVLDIAKELLVDVIVEVHCEEEMEAALALEGVRIIGVNNRDLTTLKTDISTATNIFERYKDILRERSIVPIAESGYKTREEMESLASVNCYNFLVGESLLQNI